VAAPCNGVRARFAVRGITVTICDFVGQSKTREQSALLGLLLFNPLVGTVKPQSNGPPYSNTVIGTLAVDG